MGMPSPGRGRMIQLWRARFPFPRQNLPCPYHISLPSQSSAAIHRLEMEPNSDPPSRKNEVVDLGPIGKGPAAATVVRSNFVRSNGRGSGLSAALFHAAGGPSPSSFSPIGRSGFTGSPSSSPVWWNAASGGSPTAWDPTRDNNSHPPGGFMGILNNQTNLHLVGAPSHYAPFKAPRSADVGGSFASMDTSSPSDVEILSDKQHVVVDRENENVRTEKRIMWTPKEDEVLMSAWIENSTDSTTGADRKGEAYWGDVIKAYNKNTPSQRRSAKQAKDRWHKINRWCHLFECAYLKARRVYTSGYSDQMWMDAADEFYLEDNKDEKLGPFVLKNVWKICRKVPKWISYNEELKNARKRKSYHLEEDGENLQTEDDMPKRPIGQKAAKKAALAAKDKSKAMHGDEKSKEPTVEKA